MIKYHITISYIEKYFATGVFSIYFCYTYLIINRTVRIWFSIFPKKDFTYYVFGDEFQGNPRPPITYLTGLKTITLPVLCFVGTDKFPYDEKPNPSPYFIADFKNSKNLMTIISKILDPTDIQLRRTKFNSETYEKATLRVPVGTAHS